MREISHSLCAKFHYSVFLNLITNTKFHPHLKILYVNFVSSPIVESLKNMRGEAVQIMSVNKDQKSFTLNEKALTDILTKDDVKDKPAVVISVAGAFRKGKSFLLNFFLRFLQNQVNQNCYFNHKRHNSSLIRTFA